MKIYNTHMMNNKQRFWKSFMYGLITAVACAFLVAYLNEFTAQLAHLSFPILYLFTGYAIAQSIHKAGGGISKQYSYLGAVLTIFSIIFSEIFYYMGYDILIHPQLWISAIQSIFHIWFSFTSSSILSIVFMIWGVYIAYTNSVFSRN